MNTFPNENIETEYLPRSERTAIAITSMVEEDGKAIASKIEETYQRIMGQPIDIHDIDECGAVVRAMVRDARGRIPAVRQAYRYLCGEKIAEEPMKTEEEGPLPEGTKTDPWGNVIETA